MILLSFSFIAARLCFFTMFCVSAGSLRYWATPSPPGPTWQTALPWQSFFSWSASLSCQSTTVVCTRSTALKPSTWYPGVAAWPGSAPVSAWTSWTSCGCIRLPAAATKCCARHAGAKSPHLRRMGRRIKGTRVSVVRKCHDRDNMMSLSVRWRAAARTVASHTWDEWYHRTECNEGKLRNCFWTRAQSLRRTDGLFNRPCLSHEMTS